MPPLVTTATCNLDNSSFVTGLAIVTNSFLGIISSEVNGSPFIFLISMSITLSVAGILSFLQICFLTPLPKYPSSEAGKVSSPFKSFMANLLIAKVSFPIAAAEGPPLNIYMSFLNISTPGFSSFIEVITGTLNLSLTALHILPHATPYLPALKDGPAKNMSNSLSSKKPKIIFIASSVLLPMKLSPHIIVWVISTSPLR